MTDVRYPEELIAKVREFQLDKGYTDQQMADLMGCNRRTYQQTRTRKMKLGNAFLKGAMKLLTSKEAARRKSGVITRKTGETDITIQLLIDGTGKWEIDTGVFMLNHLLSQIAKHGRFDLIIKAAGDDPHHLIEDVGICLGQAFHEALGERTGIIRMGDATVPLDEALSMVAVDLSGRPYFSIDVTFSGNDMGGFPSDMVRHFLESLAIEGRMNLHARMLAGINDHHKAESLFKALGRALDMATAVDERTRGEVPSTKGVIEGAKKGTGE